MCKLKTKSTDMSWIGLMGYTSIFHDFIKNRASINYLIKKISINPYNSHDIPKLYSKFIKTNSQTTKINQTKKKNKIRVIKKKKKPLYMLGWIGIIWVEKTINLNPTLPEAQKL